MGEHINGYITNQIIRQNSGSPATWWVFGGRTESFMIDNLGSAPIYFCFDSEVNVTNSGTAYLQAYSNIVLDANVGSISIQSSGLTSSDVQVIRLT